VRMEAEAEVGMGSSRRSISRGSGARAGIRGGEWEGRLMCRGLVLVLFGQREGVYIEVVRFWSVERVSLV
jgi:hypothetical protein